ncbi:MAG: hypothetical protein LBC13_00085 [Clostridiales bacterium]|jgi:hypothetical protein|nr:hypothetical protein [Clostridiales bacterium]
MGNYKKCPRCDLNWIKLDESLCNVCKAELHIGNVAPLIEEDDEDGVLCPVCRINYIAEDEDMCAQCRAEKGGKVVDEKIDEEDNWRQFVEEEEPAAVVNDDLTEISLTALEEEEKIDDEDEDISPDDIADDDLDLDLIDLDEDEDEESDDEI